MLTHAICRSTPRARSLHTKVAACSILCPSSSSSLRARHRQQTRAYRFSIWSSYLDPEFHRELRRRHRTIKHKYADTIKRGSSGDKYPSADEPTTPLKRFIGYYWNPTPERCASQHVNHDEPLGRTKHGSERPSAPDARTNISSTDSFWSNYDSWRSQVDRVDQVIGQRAKEASKGVDRNYDFEWRPAAADSGMKEGVDVNESTAEKDYVIDPITNRKVSKKTCGSLDTEAEPPAQTFKWYRSKFTDSVLPEVEGDRKPIYSDGGPAAAELNKYGQVKLDEWTPEGHASDPRAVKATHTSSQPAAQNEGYSLNHLPLEESPDERYNDLNKYRPVEYDEIDGNRAEVKPDDEELRKYKPYMYREDATTEGSTTGYDDLEKYRSCNYEERERSDDSTPKYDDLDSYRPTDFKDSVEYSQPFRQYGDLEKYKTFRYQDLHDNATLEQDIVAESLKEYDAKEREADLANETEPPNAMSSEFYRSTNMHDEGSVASEPEPDPASLSMPWGNSWDDPKDENREELERFMDNNNEASDAVDQEASASIQEARMRAENDTSHPDEQVPTGNRVRGFLDELSKPWEPTSHPEHKVESGVSEKAYEQELQAEIQEAEKSYSDDLTKSANFSKLEPALDRQMEDPMLGPAPTGLTEPVKSSTPSHHLEEGVEESPDAYSQEPQGLETSFAEECGEPSMPIYAKAYGEPGHKDLAPAAVETQPVSDPFISSSELYYQRDPEIDGFPPTSEPVAQSESSQPDEPTVYKILAYDSTMQNINIVETTSVVPDQAAPLSPTEVLLRLSNPTKFFPHFAPLQAEGFEIVSGGGDILVFRKVRSGIAGTKNHDMDMAAAVNPIDMMGKPSGLLNAAEFASPTGFVNYNMPGVEGETQGPSRFRSNIDVRREEPVFSGPKSSSSSEAPKKKKRGVVKRMLFAGTWVAGLSYAIGVVSEYFTTGGADGTGPTGF